MSRTLRLALPVLAVASTAYAACSNSATATIQNSGDASALASCSTFAGSIAIATGTTDDIALDGIQEITKNLVADSIEGIRRISGADLEKIGGSLEINNIQNLASLDFPKLEEVDIVKMQGLPNLQTLGFDGEVSKASEVDIQNTFLETLKGLNLEEAVVINIANNPQISEISMQVTNVTQQLTLSYNNAEVDVSFPNLASANNATFRAVGSLSLPSLESLNDSLGIFESNLETFSAPNLTTVNKFLALVGNENLNNVSFGALTNLGGNLQIANNSALHEIESFPKLEQVLGAFDISGNITKIETPKLNLVKGVFNLQSTGDIGQVCSEFYDPLRDKGRLPKSKYQCKGKLSDPGTAGTTPTGGSDGPSGAASPLDVPQSYMGLAGLLAVFFL